MIKKAFYNMPYINLHKYVEHYTLLEELDIKWKLQWERSAENLAVVLL